MSLDPIKHFLPILKNCVWIYQSTYRRFYERDKLIGSGLGG